MLDLFSKVTVYYKEHPFTSTIIEQKLMEKHLKRLVWKTGKPNSELIEERWSVIVSLLNELEQEELSSFDELFLGDYVSAACVFSENAKTEAEREDVVQTFFAHVHVFLSFLVAEKRIDRVVLDDVDEAERCFYENGHFQIPENEEDDLFFMDAEDFDEEELEELNHLLDKMLEQMWKFYRTPQYANDMERAVFLYAGPFLEERADLLDEKSESWIGFADYFLFDYHLAQNDCPPVRHYCREEKECLTPKQALLLNSLARAKFRVFTIEAIGEEYVECKDLFSDNTFPMPLPDDTLLPYEKMLFYGHIHEKGVMLLNYITSVQASQKLRKRIREEVLKQYEMFCYQDSEATLEQFFERHSAVVRHTIHIMVSYAQLNVLPQQKYPQPIVPAKEIYEKFSAALRKLELQLEYAKIPKFTIQVAQKMYADYLTLSSQTDAIKRRQTTQAAIFVVLMKMNGRLVPDWIEGLASAGMNEKIVLRQVEEIEMVLQCVPFDARYLLEDGFVGALFFE